MITLCLSKYLNLCPLQTCISLASYKLPPRKSSHTEVLLVSHEAILHVLPFVFYVEFFYDIIFLFSMLYYFKNVCSPTAITI